MRRVLLPLAEATARQLAGEDPLVRGSGCVTWHSTYETSGSAAASYSLTDGPSGNGQVLAYVTLSSSESTRDYIGLHCLPFLEGIYYDLVSGAVGGSVTAWVDHVCEDYLETEHLAARVIDAAALAALTPGGG